MHLWDVSDGEPNQIWYVGRSGGTSTAANGGQRGTEIQSNTKMPFFLTSQNYTANANLLAINITPLAQIGANL